MKINNMIKKFCIITLCLYISYYAIGRLFVNASTTSDTNVLSDDEIQDYNRFSFENVEGFKLYLADYEYDIFDLNDVNAISTNFDDLYYDALQKNYINNLQNDILLATDEEISKMNYLQDENGNLVGIVPRWTAGKTLTEENNGTHQVITKEAIQEIEEMHPNFFQTDNGIYITQLYSDYPDMEETTNINSWHFYNYNTKANYWGNILNSNTAKSMFLEHYNKAIAYYKTNKIQSFRELGSAMHYIADIATPVHTGDGIEPSDWWVGVLATMSPAIVIGIYLGDMVINHTSFEDYVDERDQNDVCKIPTNINYEYYLTTSLDTIVEELAAYSYSYYDEATGNDTNKHIAMSNTVPKAKEVIAGLLNRFATMVKTDSVYDGYLLRNKASNLYMTAVDSLYSNNSNVELRGLTLTDNQIFDLPAYNYSDSLKACNIFSPNNNSSKAIDVSGGDTSSGTNIQIYDKNSTSSQFIGVTAKMTNSYFSGYYTLNTGNTDYKKVVGADDGGTTSGTNLSQWKDEDITSNYWYIDPYKSINVNWKTPNVQKNYITKGQYVYYKLIISKNSNYVIQTYSDFDTCINLYDSNLNQIDNGIGDDDGEGLNSKISKELSIGTYYLRLKMWSSNIEGRVNLVITSSTDIPQSSNTLINEDVILNQHQLKWYKLQINGNNKNYEIYTTSEYDTCIALYDEKFNYINSDDDTGEGNNASLSINLSDYDYVYIMVRMYSDTTIGTINFTIARSHSHSYIDSYRPHNETQHRAYCECGDFILQGHIVSSTAAGEVTSTCILCNAIVEMGFVVTNNNSICLSENGSYILPNGIIVIVDADIEALMNGTLIFNKENLDSELQ